LVLIAYIDSNAQQNPHYTQYMYNMNIVNPAYAGSRKYIRSLQKQWETLKMPTSFLLFGHAPVGDNVRVGLSLSQIR
jgi:hypothetical protein